MTLATVGTFGLIALTDEPKNNVKQIAATERAVEEESDFSINELFRVKTVWICLGLLYIHPWVRPIYVSEFK